VLSTCSVKIASTLASANPRPLGDVLMALLEDLPAEDPGPMIPEHNFNLGTVRRPGQR
jgi:hypothetical protein